MEIGLTKRELRTIYKEKRMALSEDEVIFLSEKLLKNFILQFNNIENQCINIFLPIQKLKEINTNVFIKYFFDNHNRVFVPKIIGDKMISVEVFPDSEFEINKWGIKEPVSNINADNDFDIVLTPLLYCDQFGNRIGYGKGYYDRFFEFINEKTKKVGINYFEPLENVSDFNEFDVKLDYLLTPEKTYKFIK